MAEEDEKDQILQTLTASFPNEWKQKMEESTIKNDSEHVPTSCRLLAQAYRTREKSYGPTLENKQAYFHYAGKNKIPVVLRPHRPSIVPSEAAIATLIQCDDKISEQKMQEYLLFVSES